MIELKPFVCFRRLESILTKYILQCKQNFSASLKFKSALLEKFSETTDNIK